MLEEPRTEPALLLDNAQLRARLEEAESTLRAIYNCEVDTLVISGAVGPLLYTLQGLDAASSRFRGEILAQINDAVVVVDAKQRVTYLNAAAERQYGVRASEVLGKSQSSVFQCQWLDPDGETAADTALREFRNWRGENIHVRRDGSALYVESSVAALQDISGQQGGVLAVIRDISGRKRAEASIQVSEIRYRRLFEASQDGVLLVDATTRKITDANPFMTKLLGYAHEQLVGKELFEIGLLDNEIASQKMFRLFEKEGGF